MQHKAIETATATPVETGGAEVKSPKFELYVGKTVWSFKENAPGLQPEFIPCEKYVNLVFRDFAVYHDESTVMYLGGRWIGCFPHTDEGHEDCLRWCDQATRFADAQRGIRARSWTGPNVWPV